MPAISIVIPCYNAEATILATLESLLRQSFTDWEAICIDDGSTDATMTLVRSAAWQNPRIRLVANLGKGPSVARNAGALRHATAPLVAFLDADDIWHPEKLAQVVDAFADETLQAVYGQIEFFRHAPGDSRVRSTVPAGPLTIPMLLGENPVCTMSNLSVRRETFAATGGFDSAMVHNEDLEWLIRLVGDGARVIGLPALHTFYRTTTGGLSTDLAAMAAGRATALETAARYGYAPDAESHARHERYLARRALRLGAPAREALRHARAGLRHSPAGFFSPLRRGALTLAGAAFAPLLPRPLRRALFS
ncbi:glycosyltransferase family 2 protein [Oceanicola sp. 502str15]|uniref:glycosyltransferase family 2 protein n=1 Tax=Oceanicola sp. 502str15 TaxID=2696061 RepID=UPI002095042F|nr:glycosyltransferase family 2 protein [Oceanicola sp. 502str15]MCO6383013.1 glycosyltransferase [Oceanicola sp. 502str15]